MRRGSWVLVPSAISYQNKIDSRTVQGERIQAGARKDGGTAGGGAAIIGEAQGCVGSGRTVNGAALLERRPGQVVVTEESRANIRTHGFWKRGTTATFDILIVDLNAGSYLHMTPEKALANAEKENKDLYLQACLERRQTFTPMV